MFNISKSLPVQHSITRFFGSSRSPSFYYPPVRHAPSFPAVPGADSGPPLSFPTLAAPCPRGETDSKRNSERKEEKKNDEIKEHVQPSSLDDDGAVADPAHLLGGIATFTQTTALVPRIISYNINSASFYNSSSEGLSRHSKIRGCVKDLCKKCDILLLQETNLSPTDQYCFIKTAGEGGRVFNNGNKIGTAGTMIIETPAIRQFYRSESIPLPTSCNGRIQGRRFLPIDNTHVGFQVFNFYLPSGAAQEEDRAKLLEVLLDVPNDLATFFAGDFNFIRCVDDSSSTNPSLASQPFLDLFYSVCTRFDVDEVEHQEHTYHHHCRDDPSSAYSHSARLDRFYAPSSTLHHPLHAPSVSIPAHRTNYALSFKGFRPYFSDHLPISLNFSGESPQRDARPSIPQWIAESQGFTDELRKLWRTPQHLSCPFKLLSKFKKALFQAAAVARRSKIENASEALIFSQKLYLLRLTSNVVQDHSRIFRLLCRAPSLGAYVTLNDGRYVAKGLEESLSSHNANAAETKMASKHPVSAVKEMLPSTRTKTTHLRINPADAPKYDEKSKVTLAKTFWRKVWTRRESVPSNSVRARFLDGYTKRVDASTLKLPSIFNIEEAIKRSNNSTPGPDGVSFAAWRAAPDLAAPLLAAVLEALCRGVKPPRGFNHGLLFLIPKKATGLVADTRPLSVTNTDNRLLASAMAFSIMPAVSSLVEPSQKGFMWGKNGGDHIVDLNKYFYDGVVAEEERLCFFLDTAKAFDSIDHEWALQVISRTGFPPWVINFVKGALHQVEVAPCMGRTVGSGISIERGVKQGCPLSPLLFILAYDPLLFALSKVPHVSNFAFADDLALTCKRLDLIYPALSLITEFSSLSGLGINKTKSCVISSGSNKSQMVLSEALKHCPWPGLPLRPSATHLGIVIGRDVTLEMVFESPFRKATDRINKCRSAVKSMPIAQRILFVNVFIVSLFSYHFLFFILPSELYRELKGLITSLVTPYHGGAYTYETLVCLSSVFSFRPALKDLWGVNVSLLAMRSEYIRASCDYASLPAIKMKNNMFISNARDAAAVDYWRDRHDSKGSLINPSKQSSSSIYTALVEDVYAAGAASHLGDKVCNFLTVNFGFVPLPSSACVIGDISKSVSYASRFLPSYFVFFHFAFINNALATSRRMRHQKKKKIEEVETCFYCQKDQDSMVHMYSYCPVIHKARESFFVAKGEKEFLREKLLPPPFLVLFPLSASFLVEVPLRVVILLIVFNYAVWNFRTVALSTHSDKDNKWRSDRVSELANTFLRRIKEPKRKRKEKTENDPSVINHDVVINNLCSNSLVCYTDGSASPNPGPAGAGVCIYDPKACTVTDLGAELGHSTNNVGELVALGICFKKILSLCSFGVPYRVVIFTDSLFSANAVKTNNEPRSHPKIIKSLRALFSRISSLVSTEIHWIRGHCDVGGNERADRIAKRYAKLSVGYSSAIDKLGFFNYNQNVVSWPYGLDGAAPYTSKLSKAIPVKPGYRVLDAVEPVHAELDFKHGSRDDPSIDDNSDVLPLREVAPLRRCSERLKSTTSFPSARSPLHHLDSANMGAPLVRPVFVTHPAVS